MSHAFDKFALSAWPSKINVDIEREQIVLSQDAFEHLVYDRYSHLGAQNRVSLLHS